MSRSPGSSPHKKSVNFGTQLVSNENFGSMQANSLVSGSFGSTQHLRQNSGGGGAGGAVEKKRIRKVTLLSQSDEELEDAAEQEQQQQLNGTGSFADDATATTSGRGGLTSEASISLDHNFRAVKNNSNGGGGDPQQQSGAVGSGDDDGGLTSAEVQLIASTIVPSFSYLVKAVGQQASSSSSSQQQKQKQQQQQQQQVGAGGSGTAGPSGVHPYLKKLQTGLFPVLALALEKVMSNTEVLREALGDVEERAQEKLQQQQLQHQHQQQQSLQSGSTHTSSSNLKRTVSSSSSSSAAASGSRSVSPGQQHVQASQQGVRNTIDLQQRDLRRSPSFQQQHQVSGPTVPLHNYHRGDGASSSEVQTPRELSPEETAALAEKKRKKAVENRKHRWWVFQELGRELRKVKKELS